MFLVCVRSVNGASALWSLSVPPFPSDEREHKHLTRCLGTFSQASGSRVVIATGIWLCCEQGNDRETVSQGTENQVGFELSGSAWTDESYCSCAQCSVWVVIQAAEAMFRWECRKQHRNPRGLWVSMSSSSLLHFWGMFYLMMHFVHDETE